MFKKIIAVLLTVLTVFAFSSCEKKTVSNGKNTETAKKETNTETSQNAGFTLLYCDSDTFDPYSAQTKANQQLCQLLFDSLIKTDDNLKVRHCLAKKVEGNGTDKYKIYLKSAVFSDGSRVTADDVVYSIKLAKKSKTRYKNQLEKVKTYTAEGSNCVSIKLKSGSPNFAYSLDFPIVKEGSVKKIDKNSTIKPPIGSGRYVLDLKNKQISVNKKYNGQKPKIKAIQLLCAPDDESANHYIEMGGVSLVYSDLSEGKIPTMNGNLSEVHLNNLVYLGLNFKKSSLLNNENMRYAVASGIDRSAIVKQAYYSYAEPAKGPFRSEWNQAASLQNLENEQNVDVSVANLEKMGYNDKNADGYYINQNGDEITLSLLCNDNASRVAAAELIKEQLSAVGIRVIVNKVPWKTYQKELKAGNFDLYLAEVKIETDLDISPLISNKSALNFGMSKKGKANKSYSAFKKYLKGELPLSDFLNSFYTEMPFVPVCYRNGTVISSKNLSSVPSSSYSDIFYGIEQLKLN